MYRLFVAVDIPTDVRKTMAALCSGLSGAHWVPEEQFHLTLQFIGDADEALFAAIRDKLSTVSVISFPMALRGIGCFPSPGRPRVLWVGVEPCEPLLRLQREVERALGAVGIEPEGRSFSPHITLARLKDTRPADYAAFQSRHAQYGAGPFPVQEFYLYSSALTPKGAIHRREGTYALLK